MIFFVYNFIIFLNYRNAGKPHVGLQEGNHNIPQIEEIENIQNNRGNVIKVQISNIRNNQNNQNYINQKVSLTNWIKYLNNNKIKTY